MKTLKKLILLLPLAFFAMGTVSAQKYAYVDTKAILDEMPEYKEAQKKIDDMSEKWQKEIEEKMQIIDKKYKDYQREQIILPEETKRQREDEIMQLEREMKEFQRSKFGVNGELFKERSRLIEPIQDKVYKAVKDIAVEGGFSFIFDKSSQSNILYADPKLNKNDQVLKKLGVK
jgi:outer membrane protein